MEKIQLSRDEMQIIEVLIVEALLKAEAEVNQGMLEILQEILQKWRTLRG